MPIVEDDKCKYFKWLDPEIQDSTLQLFHKLFDRCDRYELELVSSRKKIKSLEKSGRIKLLFILFLLFVFVVCLMFIVGSHGCHRSMAIGFSR
ncbi:hypothetical protein ACS0TY_005668 [Phlomoides rotata]